MKIPYKILLISALLSCSSANVWAEVSQAESDAARIAMLEKALTPHSPEAVAELFAKANKNRNGAVQFMLFSDKLKKEHKHDWPYWVSGVSSPWITGYSITKLASDHNTWKFQIKYQWATADGPFKPDMVQKITVKSIQEQDTNTQKFLIDVIT